jgi:hypothetical protein
MKNQKNKPKRKDTFIKNFYLDKASKSYIRKLLSHKNSKK